MSRDRDIELIVRALIVRRSRVLLAHRRGASNTYLPGGHIEWGESAREALLRELAEETGHRLRIGGFLGSVEHVFGEGKRRTCEINLVFQVDGRSLPERLASREIKIEFLWQPVGELEGVNLQPHPLQGLIPGLAKRKRPFWASTME
jgi:8-oxo-dGTP pyrophosphatase MutT (NUDIX family)